MSQIVPCSHCHLEFDEKVMIKESDNSELNFCCNGCQGVYHLLKDDGLDSFYDKMGKKKIAPPVALGQDSSNFDMDSFTSRYIKKTSDGFSKVNLIIEGIHCAACIWLNEKVLGHTEGIVEASINFTNNKAKIVWDEDTIKLSQIIDKIRSIGYNAYPYDKTESEKRTIKKNKDYFLRMSIAIFASMNIMMIDVAKYTGFFTGMDEEMIRIIHMAEFIFATPVLFYSGWIFFRGAYYGLKNKIVNMDCLVSVGATLTYIYSLYVLFGGEGHSYFDSVAMIITFVLVGKYLEVIGKKDAVDTMDKIKSEIPLEATRIIDNGKEVVSIDQIEIGDIIEVKNGEKASVDGELLSGETLFDESSISGESLPVSKTIGSKIYSGTINTNKVIRYKALKNYADSTLNNIVELLEDSLNSKPKIEETTNELSKHFSITILIVAVTTFFGWYFYQEYIDAINSFENSLIIAISVIVIACPCALALATPIASLIGVSWLAREGLLFKEAKFIEVLAKCDTVVFDKTGTITNGKFLVKFISFEQDMNNKENINLLYSLVDSSTHPVSQAVRSYLLQNYDDLEHLDINDITNIEARGIKAKYKDLELIGGNSSFIDNKSSDSTEFIFLIDNKKVVNFELEDSIKENAKETISYLKSQGKEVIMCSGDNEKVVTKVANDVGIDNYKYKMTPIAKADFIKELKEQGKIVVMTGDGVNDALALSRSDISIVMGNGADISLGISDIVVLNDKIDGIKKVLLFQIEHISL